MGLKDVIIGFDGKRAAQNRTGLGNYSRFVINGISRFTDAERLMVYTPSRLMVSCLDGLDKDPKVAMRYPPRLWRGLLSQVWRSAGVESAIKADGVNLFHGLSNELPLNIRQMTGVKSVVTIHDLIFLRMPELYGRINCSIYDYKFRKAAENADRIVSVSECSKRDIVSFYGTDPDKIDVVYQSCDERFWHAASDEAKASVRLRHNLPEHYILYVGTIEKRKNLMLLIKAMTHLPQDVHVVAVGRRTSYAFEVGKFCAANGLRSRITVLSGVPFDDFPALYQMADAFAYPSRFEGFGIPMLEAIVSGTPAIGCTGSSLEEAGGPGSLYVDPDDDEGLAKAIDSVLTDEALRQKMIADGTAYAQNFTQEKLIADLVKVYEKVLAGE